MSCTYRTGQRFGVSHLVDVLTGAETDKIFQFDHHQLSVYGIGKALSKNQWRSVYRQLIARGLLTVDFQQYNALKLTEDCRLVLRGEQRDALRACRTQLAKDKSVPPYVIFHDTVLVDMAEKQPQTLDEFAKLSGVGQAKLEQYGAFFLKVISEFQQSAQSGLSTTVNETYQQLQQQLSPEQIAKQRQLALTTIYSHIAQLIQNDHISLHSVFECDDKQDEFMDAPKFKIVFDFFDEQYSYGVLKCVYANLIKKLNADAA